MHFDEVGQSVRGRDGIDTGDGEFPPDLNVLSLFAGEQDKRCCL